MTNIDVIDGVNHARSYCQLVLVWDAGLGLICSHLNQDNNVTSSKYTVEVFETEGELATRVSELGYELIGDE